MISLLDQKNSKQFGIDMTYKIISRSYIPYKLLSLYAINKFNDTIGIGALICLKYNDTESLKKIFAILNASYNFCPATFTIDIDKAQIKALKTCESFKNKPYIVPCLFHYSQAILKKFKNLN